MWTDKLAAWACLLALSSFALCRSNACCMESLPATACSEKQAYFLASHLAFEHPNVSPRE